MRPTHIPCCRSVRRIVALVIVMSALAACGHSAATPRATSTPLAVSRMVRIPSRTAMAAARAFLHAFQRGDRTTMVRLMTRHLRARNRHEYVAEMLGVENAPTRIEILRVHHYRAHWGAWARVVIRLALDHGTVTDRLGLIRTPAGYRVNTITYLSAT